METSPVNPTDGNVKDQYTGRRFCFWSVATRNYDDLMQDCIRSARAAGIWNDFHVFAARAIPGAITYDLDSFEEHHGYFPLLYLKEGVAKLNYDYFVWVDADMRFIRKPIMFLSYLRSSPLHVPLWIPEEFGIKIDERSEACMRKWGLTGGLYHAEACIWIVAKVAIDRLFQICIGFRNQCLEWGYDVGFDVGLAYAMQALCGDPRSHKYDRNTDLTEVESTMIHASVRRRKPVNFFFNAPQRAQRQLQWGNQRA
jgi:hypothetical protein